MLLDGIMTCLHSGLIMGDSSTPVSNFLVYLIDGVYSAARQSRVQIWQVEAKNICEHLGCYWMILE